MKENKTIFFDRTQKKLRRKLLVLEEIKKELSLSLSLSPLPNEKDPRVFGLLLIARRRRYTRHMEFPFQWPYDKGDDTFSLLSQSEINSLSAYFHDSHIYSMEPATGLVAGRPPNSSSSRKTEQAHAAATPFPPPSQRNISFGKAVLLEPKPEMEPIFGTSHVAEWKFGAQAIDRPESNAVRGSRAVSCTSEHVIAERNRREKLNQHFIALLSIIPNLKKTDKASLLSGAINYIKQLETKVKTLEQQGGCRQETEEPTADDHHHPVNISQSPLPSPSPSETIAVYSNFPVSFLEIEARLTEKTVLLRILCERSKGVLVKVLSEIEKRHLSVLSISSMPSECSTTLSITVVSNIEEGFSMRMKDLVKDLHSALSQQT